MNDIDSIEEKEEDIAKEKKCELDPEYKEYKRLAAKFDK